ncbi:MAG: STAS domain-containing protein [Tissierellales bacterium]|jgi:anti-sigma B factor antagonist|nr:STAS domain-containing protein [Tissierellales bacterium]MBN2827197.1 STAS domain-containing protein [Tissierellales bacterium]
MSLIIEKEIDHQKVRIIPIGDIDIVTSKEFKEEILKFIEEEKEILIDGQKLDYMDSTGLGVLISLLKKTRENNSKLYLSNLKPNIYKLFDITGLTDVFEILR